MNNSSGKVLIIFLIITAILLVSLTAISLFFFQKETERRKLAEATLERYEAEKVKLEESLEEIKKENFRLEEKNKESEGRVIDLSDELELEKGLREEIKLEKAALEEKLKKLEEEKAEFSKTLEDTKGAQEKLNKKLSASTQKVKELQSQLQAEKERSQKLSQLYEEKQQNEETAKSSQELANGTGQNLEAEEESFSGGVELGEIVVVPQTVQSRAVVSEDSFGRQQAAALDQMLDGRILSVDTETEFVIVSLGEKDGLSVGNVLSVYRNEDYLGDIKITRLQTEMSAADLVLPLSIRNIRKNDRVQTK